MEEMVRWERKRATAGTLAFLGYPLYLKSLTLKKFFLVSMLSPSCFYLNPFFPSFVAFGFSYK